MEETIHETEVRASNQPIDSNHHLLGDARDVISRLRSRLRAQIIGRDEVIDLILVAILADGHVLLEDFPGSGKTTLAKTLGAAITDDNQGHGSATTLTPKSGPRIASFRRIQFTPDLLPSDVTGTTVFDSALSRFQFRPGPVFTHVLLADEINRTSPKVQAALLEAMAEKQVTIDNETFHLDPLFFVIATQNPLDLAGTYPLPVAQLDRFLFKIRMDHIDRQSEVEVLDTYQQRNRDIGRSDLPTVSRDEIVAARHAIDELVAIDSRIKEALVDTVRAIRRDPRVLQGSSTRSLVLMMPALQSLATLRGRDYVSSDDVLTLLPRVLEHRVELAAGDDFSSILATAVEDPMERLARSTLTARSALG